MKKYLITALVVIIVGLAAYFSRSYWMPAVVPSEEIMINTGVVETGTVSQSTGDYLYMADLGIRLVLPKGRSVDSTNNIETSYKDDRGHTVSVRLNGRMSDADCFYNHLEDKKIDCSTKTIEDIRSRYEDVLQLDDTYALINSNGGIRVILNNNLNKIYDFGYNVASDSIYEDCGPKAECDGFRSIPMKNGNELDKDILKMLLTTEEIAKENFAESEPLIDTTPVILDKLGVSIKISNKNGNFSLGDEHLFKDGEEWNDTCGYNDDGAYYQGDIVNSLDTQWRFSIRGTNTKTCTSDDMANMYQNFTVQDINNNKQGLFKIIFSQDGYTYGVRPLLNGYSNNGWAGIEGIVVGKFKNNITNLFITCPNDLNITWDDENNPEKIELRTTNHQMFYEKYKTYFDQCEKFLREDVIIAK